MLASFPNYEVKNFVGVSLQAFVYLDKLSANLCMSDGPGVTEVAGTWVVAASVTVVVVAAVERQLHPSSTHLMGACASWPLPAHLLTQLNACITVHSQKYERPNA